MGKSCDSRNLEKIKVLIQLDQIFNRDNFFVETPAFTFSVQGSSFRIGIHKMDVRKTGEGDNALKTMCNIFS